MKMKSLILALCAVAFAGLARAEDLKPSTSEEGFVAMFNGTDLTGWDGLEGFWSVKDGVISGAETKEHPAPQTFLIYKDKFSDFEMHYKYKFATPKGNSGVQFRSKVQNEKQHKVGGYQADCDAGRGYDGSIYDEAGVAGGRGTMSNRGDKTTWNADNKRQNEKLSESNAELKNVVKEGDWNDVVLIAKGNHIVYRINGHVTTDLTDDSPKAVAEGVIALQLHAGFVMEIQFKDLKIKDLKGAGK
jgi:hypothetical protein